MFCVAVLAEFNAPQPLFGMELRSHLERSCRDIARVLEDCVSALLEYGMEEEVSVMLSIQSTDLIIYCCSIRLMRERTPQQQPRPLCWHSHARIFMLNSYFTIRNKKKKKKNKISY